MDDRPEWFAPKRYGIGIGWPIDWKGWALLSAFALVVGLALVMFGPRNPAVLSIIVPATIALLIIIARTTRGGWRWRWGEKE